MHSELPSLFRIRVEEIIRREMQPVEAALMANLDFVGLIHECQDQLSRAYRSSDGREERLEVAQPGNEGTALASQGKLRGPVLLSLSSLDNRHPTSSNLFPMHPLLRTKITLDLIFRFSAKRYRICRRGKRPQTLPPVPTQGMQAAVFVIALVRAVVRAGQWYRGRRAWITVTRWLLVWRQANQTISKNRASSGRAGWKIRTGFFDS
jgi:hypothetical protein